MLVLMWVQLLAYVISAASMKKVNYSKTCVKRPLKNRQNKDLNDKW